MKLETEFRVRLQLMQLEQAFQNTSSALAAENFPPQSSAPTWVRLVQPPNSFCENEALLLCQYSSHQWLAWIPNFGEILLDTDEFYALPDS